MLKRTLSILTLLVCLAVPAIATDDGNTHTTGEADGNTHTTGISDPAPTPAPDDSLTTQILLALANLIP
jgi:hypothetical protein